MNNYDRGMNSNNMMDRRGGFDNDNNFGGFSEDRRGFALPSFPNDMNQNNFGNNDRQVTQEWEIDATTMVSKIFSD